jgi:hypothetical protein
MRQFNQLINRLRFFNKLNGYYGDKFKRSIDLVYGYPLLLTYYRRIPGG